MRTITLSALAAAMLFGFAGIAAAQQQGGQTHNMQGMDHSRMQGMDHSKMQGMDHSNMPGMQGNTQSRSNQGARAPARSTQTRPNAPAQPRSN